MQNLNLEGRRYQNICKISNNNEMRNTTTAPAAATTPTANKSNQINFDQMKRKIRNSYTNFCFGFLI